MIGFPQLSVFILSRVNKCVMISGITWGIIVVIYVFFAFSVWNKNLFLHSGEFV